MCKSLITVIIAITSVESVCARTPEKKKAEDTSEVLVRCRSYLASKVRSESHSQEKMKLRETLDKQKRAMKKLEDKVDQLTGKKRFNPAEAFTHTKENTPLAVISNG